MKAFDELYKNGKTTYNNYTLVPKDDLQETNPNEEYFAYGTDEYGTTYGDDYIVDYIMTSSLQDDQNFFLDYEGHSNENSSMGSVPSNIVTQMKNLFRYTNIKNIEIDYTARAKVFNETIEGIDNLYKEGYNIILRLDAKLVGSDGYGGHYVIYDGHFQKNDDGTYNFNVISWGDSKEVLNLSKNQFISSFMGYIAGK